MLNLVLFNDVIFIYRLHGKKFFSLFSFNKKDCSESSSTKYNFRSEILESDLFLETFFGEKSLSGSSNHLSFFFFSLKIFFISLIIMHDIITLDFFRPLFFLFFFSCSIMNKTKFILVINGQLVILNFPICFQKIINDSFSSIRWSVSK